MLSRAALALLLAVALLAAAQCAVRCAIPAPSAKCHHHQPTKSAQCATVMVPSASQPEAPPAIVAPVSAPLAFLEPLTRPVHATELSETASLYTGPPLVLRI
jgi:hypothetical protein